MGLDPALAAAVTLRRQRGGACAAGDAVFQLSLANVLLDGGYDGVTTLGEVMPAGDHGLGTVDRLDGELVVVDGEPWRVDSTGHAAIMPAETRTPFVVLTTMESPSRIRVRDLDRDGVAAEVERLVDDPAAVVAVRLEGRFERVLVRSVPAQDPPYRPYAEVCATDEVRWEHHDFEGVFVGFRFPDLDTGATIGGLHLHGLDLGRTTGGHNHELVVHDAELSVATTHEIALALPDRSMVDLLEMPADCRSFQRLLLRRGPLTVTQLATATGVDTTEVLHRLEWMSDRGFVEEWGAGLAGLGGEPRWRITLRARSQRVTDKVAELLGDL
jgi:acetolactate decarboxylase